MNAFFNELPPKRFFIKNDTNIQWFLYIQTNSLNFDTITSLKNSIPGDNLKPGETRKY